jgi:hypothetical protein
MCSTKQLTTLTAASLILLLTSFVALAQPNAANPQASFAGQYEGIVKTDAGEGKVTLNLIEDAGKYSGVFTTPMGPFKILKGQMANGVLTLDVEKPGGTSGPMSVRKSGEGLTGTFTEAGKNITIEFRKAAADEISGEWEAVADAGGQAVPFTLSLKLDGDKVTGSSASQLGNSTISSGTWKDGKLALMLETGNGQIAMVATMVEGKLSGDFDFSGQMSGKWVAQKKK